MTWQHRTDTAEILKDTKKPVHIALNHNIFDAFIFFKVSWIEKAKIDSIMS